MASQINEDEVRAAMMLELGNRRLDTLPMEDGERRGRGGAIGGGYGAVFRGSQGVPRSNTVDLNATWSNAIAEGVFDDDDAEGVKDLENFGDGRLHAQRTPDSGPARRMMHSGPVRPSAFLPGQRPPPKASPLGIALDLNMPIRQFDPGYVPGSNAQPPRGPRPDGTNSSTSVNQGRLMSTPNGTPGQPAARPVPRPLRPAAPDSSYKLTTTSKLSQSAATLKTETALAVTPEGDILYKDAVQLYQAIEPNLVSAWVFWCIPPDSGDAKEPALLIFVGEAKRHQFPLSEWKDYFDGSEGYNIRFKTQSGGVITVNIIFASQAAAVAFFAAYNKADKEFRARKAAPPAVAPPPVQAKPVEAHVPAKKQETAPPAKTTETIAPSAPSQAPKPAATPATVAPPNLGAAPSKGPAPVPGGVAPPNQGTNPSKATAPSISAPLNKAPSLAQTSAAAAAGRDSHIHRPFQVAGGGPATSVVQTKQPSAPAAPVASAPVLRLDLVGTEEETLSDTDDEDTSSASVFDYCQDIIHLSGQLMRRASRKSAEVPTDFQKRLVKELSRELWGVGEVRAKHVGNALLTFVDTAVRKNGPVYSIRELNGLRNNAGPPPEWLPEIRSLVASDAVRRGDPAYMQEQIQRIANQIPKVYTDGSPADPEPVATAPAKIDPPSTQQQHSAPSQPAVSGSPQVTNRSVTSARPSQPEAQSQAEAPAKPNVQFRAEPSTDCVKPEVPARVDAPRPDSKPGMPTRSELPARSEPRKVSTELEAPIAKRAEGNWAARLQNIISPKAAVATHVQPSKTPAARQQTPITSQPKPLSAVPTKREASTQIEPPKAIAKPEVSPTAEPSKLPSTQQHAPTASQPKPTSVVTTKPQISTQIETPKSNVKPEALTPAEPFNVPARREAPVSIPPTPATSLPSESSPNMVPSQPVKPKGLGSSRWATPQSATHSSAPFTGIKVCDSATNTITITSSSSSSLGTPTMLMTHAEASQSPQQLRSSSSGSISSKVVVVAEDLNSSDGSNSSLNVRFRALSIRPRSDPRDINAAPPQRTPARSSVL